MTKQYVFCFVALVALSAMTICAHAAEPLRVVISSDDSGFSHDYSELLNARGAKAVESAALTAGSLDQAGVLVLYAANAKPLSPDSRQAIEKFAARGGGIVLVSNAIALGDPAFLKPLAGGAWAANSRKFSSHMMLYALTDVHPITQNATPFDIDDDTLYDLDTDRGINVLASAFTPKATGKRADSRSPERLDRVNVYDLQPQMWTYEGADKHRAFVLLQGREAALKHPSIRSFILRGIAWAGKRENADEFCNKEDLATLRYPKDGARTADDTVKSFDLQPGFKASAIASEPLINKPIAMQWDARGRMWIAETPEYPNGRRPMVADAWKETASLFPGKYDRPARDRISILSDPDANGRFTKKTVFYEGLELVTGFCLYGDGVVAVGQPDIVFIHGEGAQQKVERLFTGFTPGDTHFVTNHFIAAPDGWIYADTGSGPQVASVPHPEIKTKLSGGIFRFKPDGSAIEQVSSKGGNSFGGEYTSDGEVFFGQATSGNPVQHVVLPEWILSKARIHNAPSAESVIKGRKVVRTDMPTRAPFMQIDVVGGYSSACASTVYEAGAWPAEWDHGVFCTEPILDIIHHEKLVAAGPSFTGQMVRTDSEWLRAHDFWFFPVNVQFGPDGAMYVLDFYCPVVAHSDTRGPQHSKSSASVRPDRDHYFGRIYRIQHDDAKKLELPDLAGADAPALVKAFTHPNKFVRFTAHRLLMDKPDASSAVPALAAMAEKGEFTPARILALWALQRLGKLESGLLQTALKSNVPAVRKAALLILEDVYRKTGNQNILAGDTGNLASAAASLFNDPDARVRLTAFRALASAPINAGTAAALMAVLPSLEDDWTRSAATAVAASNSGPMLEAALATPSVPTRKMLDLAVSLSTTIAEKQDGAALARMIVAASKVADDATPLARAALEAAASRIPAPPADTAGLNDALASLLASKDHSLSASALPYAIAWDKSGALKGAISTMINDQLAIANDSKQPDAARASAVRGLLQSRAADSRIVGNVAELLKTKLGDALLIDVITALAETGDPALGKPLVSAYPTLSPAGQTAAFDALASRADWSNAVLDALQAKELKPELLGTMRLSKLRLHSDTATASRAQKLLSGAGGATNAEKDAIIAKLLPDVESKPGDAAKGKALFTVTCAVCHKLNGVGNEVGPVLDGIGVHPTQELLVHIIDPSRVVDQEHRTWNIVMKNGKFATGIIARENEESLLLRLGGGVEQEIKIAEIKTRKDSGLSLMPEGFESLGAEGLRDILAHLRGGNSKYRAINLATAFTTDTLKGLYASREEKNGTLRIVKYGVVTVEGVPFSLPDPSTTPTSGNVIVLKNKDGKDYAASFPQRVEIPVGFEAGNLHFLGGVAGWGGKPGTLKPAMKLTIEHTDGKKQIEELNSGDVFIDYNSHLDVPGSKRVSGIVDKNHVRYFSIPVANRAPIAKLILESYKNGIAPTTLAITADTDAPHPRAK